MKIVVNAVSAKSGGAATYVCNLISAVSASKHGYVVYTARALKNSVETRPAGNITVVPTDVGYRSCWSRFWWDQIQLRKILKAEQADVLISSSDFGMLFPPCNQLLLLRNPLFFSKLYGDRILPGKSWKFKLEFLLRRWLIALSTRSSHAILTASQSMRNDVRRAMSIPEARIGVNYFGVPLERFPADRANGAGRPFTMLYVSEYSDYKNLTTLLKATLIMREKGRADFRLVTTADPYQRPHEQHVSRAEDLALAAHPLLAPVLQFTGPLPYEEALQLYAHADLFVCPSIAESFGHPLVEAMASGLPIVASDIPLCREICGDAALYFSPLAPGDLADKLMLLAEDPSLRRRLGECGRKRAEAQFDWKDHVRRLVTAVERLAGEHEA